VQPILAIGAGIAARSLLLTGFGFDSNDRATQRFDAALGG
jgi:hypothetical protein